MKRMIRHIPLLAVVLAVGCSSMSFNHDWDRDADFPSYRTYAWIDQQTDPATGNAQTARVQNSLLVKRIRSAVDSELRNKGLSVNTDSPDLLLVYHTGLQDKVNVTDYTIIDAIHREEIPEDLIQFLELLDRFRLGTLGA